MQQPYHHLAVYESRRLGVSFPKLASLHRELLTELLVPPITTEESAFRLASKSDTELPILTIRAHDDYALYPRAIYDLVPIVYDLLLSGHPDPEVYGSSQMPATKGVFHPKTFFELMEKFAARKLGEGWEPVPVAFRVTGVQFYPTTKSGGIAQPPRRDYIKIPVLFLRTGAGEPELKVITTPNKLPLAHFYIEGYWVIRFRKGDKETKLYGIATEGQVHTWVHAPYDKQFATELMRVRQTFAAQRERGIIKWYYLGRSYDREAVGMKKASLVKSDWIQGRYFKIAIGDLGKDLIIIKLSDIVPGAAFPP